MRKIDVEDVEKNLFVVVDPSVTAKVPIHPAAHPHTGERCLGSSFGSRDSVVAICTVVKSHYRYISTDVSNVAAY
jgi:hypothetical protein